MVYNQNLRVMRATRSHLQRAVEIAIGRATKQVREAGATSAENFYLRVTES